MKQPGLLVGNPGCRHREISSLAAGAVREDGSFRFRNVDRGLRWRRRCDRGRWRIGRGHSIRQRVCRGSHRSRADTAFHIATTVGSDRRIHAQGPVRRGSGRQHRRTISPTRHRLVIEAQLRRISRMIHHWIGTTGNRRHTGQLGIPVVTVSVRRPRQSPSRRRANPGVPRGVPVMTVSEQATVGTTTPPGQPIAAVAVPIGAVVVRLLNRCSQGCLANHAFRRDPCCRSTECQH